MHTIELVVEDIGVDQGDGYVALGISGRSDDGATHNLILSRGDAVQDADDKEELSRHHLEIDDQIQSAYDAIEAVELRAREMRLRIRDRKTQFFGGVEMVIVRLGSESTWPEAFASNLRALLGREASVSVSGGV